MKYALVGCTVLDGTKDMTAKENMTVIVNGDKIEAVKKTHELNLDGMEIIDLNWKYLCPGLIDTHVHLPGSGKPVSLSILPKNDGTKMNIFKSALYKSMESGLIHDVILKMVQSSLTAKINSGVTTCRSVGELCWTDLENRELINNGKYIGPHLLVSGAGISVPNGHMAGTMATVCRSEDDCRKAVDTAAEKGVDWIKIFVTGGVLDASENGEPAALRMPLEIAKAACDEAHKKGFKVASHAESKEGVRISLKAGADSIEHGAQMDEEIIDLFKRNKSTLTLTVSPAIAIAKLPGKITGMDEKAIKSSVYVMNEMIEGAKQALANGIPLALGTDASCPYVTQYDMWREIYYFSKFCGVSNTFALHSATLGNAQILGISDKTGSIEPGKTADMIVLDKNPLEDLTALRNVKKVIVGGKLIDKPQVKKNKKIENALDMILKDL